MIRASILALMTSLALITPMAASAADVRGGVISNVQGSSFSLRNGIVIFMHDGTVINPTGSTLQPGMAVTIIGTDNGNGTINANEVDIRGTGEDTYYRGPERNGWYDVNGNFHVGRPAPTGYYDVNGVFHAMPASNGWYDVNGNWHPGGPNGFYLGPDGMWHQY